MEEGGQGALAGAPALSWDRSQAHSPARTHSWGRMGARPRLGSRNRGQDPWLGLGHPTRQGTGSPRQGGPQGPVEGTKGSTEVVGQNPVLAPHQTARHLSQTPLFTAPAPGYMQEPPQDKPGTSAPCSTHHPACPPSASG